MKRVIIIAIFVVLFLSMIAAQTTNTEQKAGEGIKNNVQTYAEIKNKTDTTLDKPIPEKYQPYFGTFFRIPKQELNYASVILVSVLFVALFILFSGFMDFFLVTGKGAMLSGIILAVILSMLGVLKSLTFFLQNLGQNFSFIKNWNASGLIITIVVILILVSISRGIMNTIKKKKELAEAKAKGEKAAESKTYVDSQRKTFRKFYHRAE